MPSALGFVEKIHLLSVYCTNTPTLTKCNLKKKGKNMSHVNWTAVKCIGTIGIYMLPNNQPIIWFLDLLNNQLTSKQLIGVKLLLPSPLSLFTGHPTRAFQQNIKMLSTVYTERFLPL